MNHCNATGDLFFAFANIFYTNQKPIYLITADIALKINKTVPQFQLLTEDSLNMQLKCNAESSNSSLIRKEAKGAFYITSDLH